VATGVQIGAGGRRKAGGVGMGGLEAAADGTELLPTVSRAGLGERENASAEQENASASKLSGALRPACCVTVSQAIGNQATKTLYASTLYFYCPVWQPTSSVPGGGGKLLGAKHRREGIDYEDFFWPAAGC
jgi:hypothetical protein